jgi:hypothetical protein
MWAFNRWLEDRGGAGAAEARLAVDQVRAFFEAHGDSRFQPLDYPDAKPVAYRAGWRSGEGADRVWYVPSESWKSICSGLDAKAVAKVLGESGLIEKAGDGWQSVRRIGGASKRVYVLKGVLDDGDAKPTDEGRDDGF